MEIGRDLDVSRMPSKEKWRSVEPVSLTPQVAEQTLLLVSQRPLVFHVRIELKVRRSLRAVMVVVSQNSELVTSVPVCVKPV